MLAGLCGILSTFFTAFFGEPTALLATLLGSGVIGASRKVFYSSNYLRIFSASGLS
jgi:hypothetical protein